VADGVEFSTDEDVMYARIQLSGHKLRIGTVDKDALYKAGLEDEWQQLMRRLAATVKENT
jgi:hypothetical protein